MKNNHAAIPIANLLTNDNTLPLLVFTVGKQMYSLPITSVVRIIEMVTITRLPGMSDPVQGVINLQGNAVPVIDLRQRFKLPAPTYGLHTPIILVDINGDDQILGLIVDTVEEVRQISCENLEITDMFMPTELAKQMTAQAAHLAGIAKIERQMIPVLNVYALLTQAEQVSLSQILAYDKKLTGSRSVNEVNITKP